MMLRKTARLVRKATVTLAIAGAIIFTVSGCNPAIDLLNLNMFGQWVSHLLG